ncbi:MAG: hypothetical protein H0X67_04295 [Acidobacteria bacterium]|nr:hypothetical protein [Acidobacteriota bacterium]
MPEKKRPSALLKIVIALVVVAVLGYLFIHSLETTRSEPYLVERAHLGKWTLVLEPAQDPNAPLLSVRTSIELVASLFRQLFHRAMESMNTPPSTSVPIVLLGEFERGLAGRMTPDDLLTLALEAGLESASHEPRCLAHLRISEPGLTRQAYFAVMDSPAIVSFREQLAAGAAGSFDAGALTPIMFVGASDPAFHRWLPIQAEEGNCLSPIEVKETLT